MHVEQRGHRVEGVVAAAYPVVESGLVEAQSYRAGDRVALLAQLAPFGPVPRLAEKRILRHGRYFLDRVFLVLDVRFFRGDFRDGELGPRLGREDAQAGEQKEELERFHIRSVGSGPHKGSNFRASLLRFVSGFPEKSGSFVRPLFRKTRAADRKLYGS
jgi:hypothetical protein